MGAHSHPRASQSPCLLFNRLKFKILNLWSHSVQFSHSVVSDSLWPHGLQHARPPCPSPTPRAHSNSCPSSRWYHPTISSCRPLLLPPSIFPNIRVFSNESALCLRCVCEVAQSCPTLCDPVDCSPPGSSVHGFSRQEYWSGLPFPFPGDLPNPGIEPRFPSVHDPR